LKKKLRKFNGAFYFIKYAGREIKIPKEEMFLLLEKLTAEKKQVWGKMNAQQMLEHLADFLMSPPGK
jgi:hypothetical protein